MTQLSNRFPNATGLVLRALKQAARELLLAQSSDWPFILRTGTSPAYAKKRVKDHILRFIALHEQLTTTKIDETWLAQIESMDNLFHDVDPYYWAGPEPGSKNLTANPRQTTPRATAAKAPTDA